MKKIIASMALVAVTSPALAQDYLGEMRRESNDYWSNLSRSYTERQDTREVRPRTWGMEPGHMPYPCGSITASAARRDCQANRQAHNPNDYLNYDR